jgi:hypothetical protein
MPKCQGLATSSWLGAGAYAVCRSSATWVAPIKSDYNRGGARKPSTDGSDRVDFFNVRRLPFMARRNFLLEMHHTLLWGVFAGLVEGTVSAVVVSKTFGGSNLLITVVQATPAFANLVSLLWGAMILGRRKIPVMTALGAASAAVTLSVIATPISPMGGWIFALQVCLSRVFMSGVVTTRASLWKSNYPRSHRGRITASLQIIRTLVGLPVILGCGVLFDVDPLALRWFYPAIAVIGFLGLALLRFRMSVRGERAALAAQERPHGEPIAETGLVAPFSLVALISPWQIVGRMNEALRQDPRFARYCQAQMCIGSANLMVMAVNTIILTKVLHLSYTSSNTLLDVIPRIVTIVMLPMWARFFDRVGVLRFRVVNSLCWTASLGFCGTAFAWAAPSSASGLAGIGLLAYLIGRLADGLAQSGGAIAWNIGHLHFAEDDKAELYMGIHVSLTGLRGFIAPFIGRFLYHYIDWGVFVVAIVLSQAGHSIFSRLAREEKHAASHRSRAVDQPAEEPAGCTR